MKAAIAYESIPKLGEFVNGDAVVVRRTESDRLLFAVIDGLGHGPAAARASNAAVTFLETAQIEQPLYSLMEALSAALRGTRGAAATVCAVQADRLAVCAVGNVQLSSTNADIPLVLSSGVLGQRVPKYRVCEAKLRSGARLALYSDGISSRFRLEDFRKLRAAEACKLVMERQRKREDDATILIADMEG